MQNYPPIDPKEIMTQSSTIIFVCEHGAAKSIIAASYFNKLAGEKGLNITAVARGTHPDEVLSPKTIIGLQNDNVEIAESTPIPLLFIEIKIAQKMITFCNLQKEAYEQGVEVEDWSDVPPVSESYEIARDAILEKLKSLITSLQNE